MEFPLLAGLLEGFARLSLEFLDVGFDFGKGLGFHAVDEEDAGEVVDTAGTVVGQHQGYERFTVGQRRGLGIAFGEPRYVVAIEPESHRVVVGERQELARDWLELAWPGESGTGAGTFAWCIGAIGGAPRSSRRAC